MFVEEALSRLRIPLELYTYTVTFFGSGAAVVSGIKGVLFISQEEVRVRLRSGTVSLFGEELVVEEIGGGDIYVRGRLKEVRFD